MHGKNNFCRNDQRCVCYTTPRNTHMHGVHIYDPLDSAEVHNSGYTRVFLITVSEWRYIIIRVP